MPSPPTGPKPGAPRLSVFVDGQPMPDDEARAFWGRFSAYMEEHKGDLGGFAKVEGYASVHPEMRPVGAVLVASRSAAQRPYTNVSSEGPANAPARKPNVEPHGSTRGSGGAQARRGGGAPGRPDPAKSRGKRR